MSASNKVGRVNQDAADAIVTVNDLPPRGTTRWVPQRKAEVVAAVGRGLLTIADACERYGLSLEEFVSWQRAIARGGLKGLRSTKLQHYRGTFKRV